MPTEYPLTIEINGVPCGTLLCTPDHLEELVAGWCFNQGFIESADDLASIRFRGARATVMLHRSLPGGHDWREQLMAGFDAGLVSSSVGQNRTTPPARDGFVVPASKALSMLTLLYDQFWTLDAPAGSHFTGALNAATGTVICFHDYSRHNVLDKLIGWGVLSRRSLDRDLVLISGRISGDLVYKAARAGVRILATRAIPSAQAIRLAQGTGITVIGRALESGRTVYTHPWRLERNPG